MGRRGRMLTAAVVALCALATAACAGDSNADDDRTTKPAPTPPSASGECKDFTIAWDPSNGYEVSALIVGALAADELGCDVHYRAASPRDAWRLVANGEADVYLDAYASEDVLQRLTRPRAQVTVVGPNGIQGGVDLVAPEFMAERGLETSRDLSDDGIGWGPTKPAITTVPELMPLARSLVAFEGIDYAVRNYGRASDRGMGDLLTQAAEDDGRGQPGLYLVAAPRLFLGDVAGRRSVHVPGSAANECRPGPQTTVCSLEPFPYLKVVNAAFAKSGSPAYSLVYHYRLTRSEAANVLEIVRLSGYDVQPADATAWINTHEKAWQRWLR